MRTKYQANDQEIARLEKKVVELQKKLNEKRKISRSQRKNNEDKVVNAPGEFFEKSHFFGDPY